MKVVAFNGSPRANGNTRRLLHTALEPLAQAGIETELISVGGQVLRGCIACYQCGERLDRRCTIDSDRLNEYIAKMVEADGIIIGSPTYFADLTSECKALIDRAGFVCRKNGNLLRRKVGAAVVSVRRAGAVHAFDSINHFFTISQMVVVGSSYWNLGMGGAVGEVENDAEGLETMRTLGDNMAWVLQRLAG